MSVLQRSFKIRKSSKKVREEEAEEDRREVHNLNDLHLTNKVSREDSSNRSQPQKSTPSNIHRIVYDGSEDNVECFRFPHMKFCGCQTNCLYSSFEIYQILPELCICGFESGTKTRKLLQHNITHVLNLTSKEYTKRTHFFQYLNIDIHSDSEEDIKKFFRITNRFIDSNTSKGGTVLIHSSSVTLSACFALSYLIGIKRIPIKGSVQIIKKSLPSLEFPPHFVKQLESYDLEKLAFVTIKRET